VAIFVREIEEVAPTLFGAQEPLVSTGGFEKQYILPLRTTDGTVFNKVVLVPLVRTNLYQVATFSTYNTVVWLHLESQLKSDYISDVESVKHI
jgi:hypothetical protein